MKSVCLLFLTLVSISVALGQRAKQYTFTHFSTVNGLVSNSANAIVQDKDGFMWIATDNGLQRYDGNSFITFQKGGKNQLPDDRIITIFKDEKQNIWLTFSNNEVGIFDTRSFKFRPVNFPGKLGTFLSNKNFFYGHDGHLYLLDIPFHIYRYQPETHSMAYADAIFPFPKTWRVQHILWNNKDKSYLAAADSGFLVFDPFSKRINYRGHNPDKIKLVDSIGHMAASSIQIDEKGILRFTTWPRNDVLRLHEYDMKSGRHKKYNLSKELGYSYHEISGILTQPNRSWIFGNPILTLWLHQPTRFLPITVGYKNEQSIRFDYLHFIYEDKENNLWLCTDNGLYFFNPDAQNFNAYNLLRAGSTQPVDAGVTSIMENQNTFFVGSWGQGFYCYDKNMNPVAIPKSLQPFQDNYSVWDIHQHSKSGTIWLALQAGELLVYDTVSGTTKFLRPAIFENRTIRQVTEDKYGNLWFGTQSGKLVKWDYRKGATDIESGFQMIRQTGLIRKLMCDKQGFLWVATEAKGLHKIDPSNNRIIKSFLPDSPNDHDRLGGVAAYDIMQYNDSTFIAVVGTLDIINTNTNTIKHLTKEEGFPTKSAYCGVVDETGIAWIGTTDGICRVNVRQQIFTMYNRDDGIINDNLFLGSAFNLSGGRIAFTTSHDFFVFDPTRIVQKSIPQPRLTAFNLGGETLSVDSLEKEERIVLPYDKNSIQFVFSTLNFLQRKKLRYYYKLEGLDKNWRVANELNQAVYNYLPPGEYHLRIRAENADGASSKEFKSFVISIRPPFWKTWWFIGLLILLGIGLLMLMDRERMRRLTAMQQMRSQIASDLHGEINTTLNNINILSEMAKLKAEKDVMRSKEYIEQISEKSSSMIIAMDDMLWSRAPENDSMRETHLRLQEFADAMRSRYGAQIHLVVDSKVEELQMDMKVRHELFLILKLALRLIVEDGNGRNTIIHIGYTKSKLYVKMKDEEVRLVAAKPLTKKRVDEIKKRASVIGAELDILDNQNGIIIVLILPL